MAYEKHTWVNNETITANKLNNIEDGIEEAAQSGGGGASVQVNFMTQISYTIEMGLVDMTTGPTESRGEYFGGSCEYGGGGYYPKTIIDVPLPDANGTIQSAIVFSEYYYVNFNFAVTGDVTEPVPVNRRYSASSFESATMYACIVTGNGTITLTPA